jgi:uncharacterized protein YoxC
MVHNLGLVDVNLIRRAAMHLQNTFYILAIILMSLIFLLIIAIVIALFTIRAKVIAIHNTIDEKLSMVTGVANAGASILKKARSLVDDKQ